MLTLEQKKRVSRFRPMFERWLRAGTLEFCRKLWLAGSHTEALIVGSRYKITKSDIINSITS